MAEIRALIAAAGRGTRAGLPYPKTLFALQGRSILLRLLDLLAPYDREPTVIVSPEGKGPIQDCVHAAGVDAALVVQPSPRGMGDSVLHFLDSPHARIATDVLLVWGDIPFMQPATVAAVVARHNEAGNDFTFATRKVASAYTIVSRNGQGEVDGVVETREIGIRDPLPGEREIGLFLFRKELVLQTLQEELAGKWGKKTGEHGFLYIIGHLAARGCKVEALPVATELDLVSLNSLKDVHDFM